MESAAPDAREPPLATLLLHQPELSGNRLFEPAFYRIQARMLGIDVAEHPLAHYARGKAEGKLDPHPLFCESFYVNRYRDLGGRPLLARALHHLGTGGPARPQSAVLTDVLPLRQSDDAADGGLHLGALSGTRSAAAGSA